MSHANYEIHFLSRSLFPGNSNSPVPTHTESSTPIPSQAEFWKSGLLAASRCHSAQFLKELFWGQEVGWERTVIKKYLFSLSVKLWELLDCASWSQIQLYSLFKVTYIKTTNDSRFKPNILSCTRKSVGHCCRSQSSGVMCSLWNHHQEQAQVLCKMWNAKSRIHPLTL